MKWPWVDDETCLSDLRPWKQDLAKQLRTFPSFTCEICPPEWESGWMSIRERDTVMFEVFLNFWRALRLEKKIDKSTRQWDRLWLHTSQDKHWNILSQTFQQKILTSQREKTYICSTKWVILTRVYWSNVDIGLWLTIKGLRLQRDNKEN